MSQTESVEELLLEHIRTLPLNLRDELRDPTKTNRLNGGDFTLRFLPKSEAFFLNINIGRPQEGQMIVLQTPTVTFAYDPKTGNEIGNTLDRYGVTDRTTLRNYWRRLLHSDSEYLISKGLTGLGRIERDFVSRL